jgi:hypothetical protein
MVGVAVTVAAAALNEEPSKLGDVDIGCVLGGKGAVSGGGDPILGWHGLGRASSSPSGSLGFGLVLFARTDLGRESSVSWISVFLFRPCDTVGCITVIVGAVGGRHSFDGIGVADQCVQAGAPSPSGGLLLGPGDHA